MPALRRSVTGGSGVRIPVERMYMKTAGFVFAAILSAAIMFGTVIAGANAGMSPNPIQSHVVATS
jgi:uncharacterized membrane protein YczE